MSAVQLDHWLVSGYQSREHRNRAAEGKFCKFSQKAFDANFSAKSNERLLKLAVADTIHMINRLMARNSLESRNVRFVGS